MSPPTTPRTKQWTIIRNGTFSGRYLTKRLIVICSSYKWGDHEMVEGPDACHLQVGQMIVPNQMPKIAGEFVDVYEMPSETLAITEGADADRVSQQLDIRKYEVLTDEPAK